MKYRLVSTVIVLTFCMFLAASCKPKVGREYHPKGTKGGAMFFIPKGEFTMGCSTVAKGGPATQTCFDQETPTHKVNLSAFFMDKYEVTGEEYDACVKAGKCSNLTTGKSCNWGVPDRNKHPVNCVDWNQAQAYCQWAGKRLPTEAEWEKAAKGTDGRMYPWGDQTPTCDYAVMVGCGKNSTMPVGSVPKGASPYSVMDMAGNVWEWTSDFYEPTFYKNSPSSNPTGPESSKQHTVRGGSWADSITNLRSPGRQPLDTAIALPYYGFRCSRTY